MNVSPFNQAFIVHLFTGRFQTSYTFHVSKRLSFRHPTVYKVLQRLLPPSLFSLHPFAPLCTCEAVIVVFQGSWEPRPLLVSAMHIYLHHIFWPVPIKSLTLIVIFCRQSLSKPWRTLDSLVTIHSSIGCFVSTPCPPVSMTLRMCISSHSTRGKLSLQIANLLFELLKSSYLEKRFFAKSKHVPRA